MPSDKKIEGILMPMPVAFKQDGAIDHVGTDAIIDFYLDAGVHGFFPLGTHGQGMVMEIDERKKVAEQIIFRERANAVQVLTRSDEDSLLTFDEKGGVKEVAITGERVVLTDDVIRRLVTAASAIKRVFGSRDQDIEWAYMKGQIYIVQSRPFIAGG